METGSGRSIEIAPFHSRGALKGFVVSGRWPNSTKRVGPAPDGRGARRIAARIAFHHNHFSAFAKNCLTSRNRGGQSASSSPRAPWSVNQPCRQGISPTGSRRHF